MNFKTAYNHTERLKKAVSNAYSSAMHYCPTHEELIATIAEIRKDPAWKKLPAWAQQSVNNHNASKFEDIQRNWTIWLFPQPEGPALSWDEMPEDVRKSYCSADKKGTTFWLRRKSSESYSHSFGRKGDGQTLVRTFEITDNIW